MIVIDEKFLVIKEINGYLVDMILINSFRSGLVIIISHKGSIAVRLQAIFKTLDKRRYSTTINIEIEAPF
jgi:hypothetical protein